MSSTTVQRTYELATGPIPLSFEVYERRLVSELEKLLDRSPDERVVQSFLEKHPALLPGAWAPGGGSTGLPINQLLVTQPSLPGLDGRRPDFMWFAADSARWYPTLIEIEAPAKRVFNKRAHPTADFSQARHQLAQWRTWFSNATNQSKFCNDYCVPQELTATKAMKLRMILIYGRRSEFRDDADLSRQRASLLPGHDEELCSFDRLSPDPLLRDAICVRATRGGRYAAVAVPPTFALGPTVAERLLVLDGFESALDSSAGWSPQRRTFVRERVPYWREWAKISGKGWAHAADRE